MINVRGNFILRKNVKKKKFLNQNLNVMCRNYTYMLIYFQKKKTSSEQTQLETELQHLKLNWVPSKNATHADQKRKNITYQECKWRIGMNLRFQRQKTEFGEPGVMTQQPGNAEILQVCWTGARPVEAGCSLNNVKKHKIPVHFFILYSHHIGEVQLKGCIWEGDRIGSQESFLGTKLRKSWKA